MKKYLLFNLIIIVALMVSCSKSQKNNVGQNNSFVPVIIDYDKGACVCCGSGYFVFRQDSAITYKSDSLPANSGITTLPVNAKIRFHIVGNFCSRDLIVIDEIKL